MVMVDHLGKVRPSDRYKGNMVAETGEKSDAFMAMSAELNVAAVLAHQLNRNTEGREDKRPQPADLRDSGNLEQDTNTLLFPYRPSYYLEKQKSDDQGKEMVRLDLLESKRNILEAIVSKCRNGACGTVDLFVDMPSNHIEDLSYG
jgi:replicative DNA helicase